MRVSRVCEMCGGRNEIELSEQEWKQYRKWRAREIFIQDIKTLNRCEREFLKTGYCPKCQEMIFANGETERIKQEKQELL